MNNITGITKRDIFDLFSKGLNIDILWDTQKIIYPYYGRLSELEFLKRLYPLEQMPSSDPRFMNAEGDIWQHTVNNDDYPFCWIFDDDRFPLKNGNDEDFLRFLCEIFHPIVRNEEKDWFSFLKNFILINRFQIEIFITGEFIQINNPQYLYPFPKDIKKTYYRRKYLYQSN